MFLSVDIDKAAETVAEELRRIDKWKQFILRNDTFYYRFLSGLIQLFEKQQAEIIAQLDAFQRSISPERLAQKIRSIPDEVTLDKARWELIFEEFGQLLLPEVIQDRGQKELMQLYLGVSFDVKNPRVLQFLEEDIRVFKKANDTTMDAIKKALVKGVSEGEGIPKLKMRISEVFEGCKGYRAERIARTQVIGASNFGAFEGYKQSGVVERKEWLATKDDRTRPDHAAIDGQIVGLDETFSNGLRFPGDPRGSAEDVINCRCTVLPWVKR